VDEVALPVEVAGAQVGQEAEAVDEVRPEQGDRLVLPEAERPAGEEGVVEDGVEAGGGPVAGGGVAGGEDQGGAEVGPAAAVPHFKSGHQRGNVLRAAG